MDERTIHVDVDGVTLEVSCGSQEASLKKRSVKGRPLPSYFS
jgi:hypothetical protein